jgi:hypothetical protein
LSVGPAPVEVVEDISSSAKILQAVKDNQLLTALSLFVLWELNLFDSVMVYGCGF